MIEVLVLYYSRNSGTAELARSVARGVEHVPGVEACLRTVPPVRSGLEPPLPEVPDSGPPYLQSEDLHRCAGLALGSPVRFGQMAAALKFALDASTAEWVSGALAGKPAAVFTSGSSSHGGQESTLLSMMLPLLHHGMLMVGLPFTEPRLADTAGGGSPYGGGRIAKGNRMLDDERVLAEALGQRLAEIARKLASP